MANEKADAVVAADGSGNFTTIAAAIAAAPLKSASRHVIHVKAGVYKEFVVIGKEKPNIALIGDGMEKTMITESRCCADSIKFKTPDTAIVSVHGDGFLAQDICIENQAGPRMENGQAVALLCSGDRCAVYRCSLKSYQDTLYAVSNKQFYRECRISGTVDFVFGDASAVFQKCELLARLPLQKQRNTITAQGKDRADSNTGFIFQNCTVAADDDLSHSQAAVETYLGRPWKAFSRTVFMQCSFSGIVHELGWLQWEKDPVPDTLFYAEYKNTGPGADVSHRVKWPGFHVLHDATQVVSFTVANFINETNWLQSTGVPFTP
ncbi:hypothetical protein EJB05_43571, partial [Eragrostis curvula]